VTLNLGKPALAHEERHNASRFGHCDVFADVPKARRQLSERDKRAACEDTCGKLIGRVILAAACRGSAHGEEAKRGGSPVCPVTQCRQASLAIRAETSPTAAFPLSDRNDAMVVVE
jgi:hypothetical protein